jgi:hypothetical protein
MARAAMKPRLNVDKIAKGLGGERRGPFTATGGHFGALNLTADIVARFRVPQTGVASQLLEKVAENATEEEILGLVAEGR